MLIDLDSSNNEDEQRKKFQSLFTKKMNGQRFSQRSEINQEESDSDASLIEHPKIKQIVTEILKCKNQRQQKENNPPSNNNQTDPKKLTQSKKGRRTKWTEESNAIFFKLFKELSGDLNMISDYFCQHTSYNYSQKQIKKKYSLELKENPQKIKLSQKKHQIKRDEFQN